MENRIIAKNGIPIFSYVNPSSHGFFISLFLRSGSMYESERDNGITHFLEHIAIRNVNKIMGGNLYSTLDKYAIEFNASSYSEMVQFYLSGASENIGVAIDIISKLLMPISLPTEDIEAERDRIKAEIREGDEVGSLSAFTQKNVWESTSLSRPITGTRGGVSKITRSRIENYRYQSFTKDNLFLYVTGNVKDSDIMSLSERIGEYKLNEGTAHNNLAPVPNNFGKRGGKVTLKNADFTKVCYTFDLDMSRLSMPEIDLMYDTMLGGYSSKFFIEMSEKRGLFYDINGSVERYGNIGTLSFTYEVKEQQLIEATELTIEILKHFKTRLLEDCDLFKASYVDNAMMLYDDNRELNFTMAYDNHILGLGYENLEARREAYRAITPERFMVVANTIFTPDNLTVTLKGRHKKINTDEIKAIICKL